MMVITNATGRLNLEVQGEVMTKPKHGETSTCRHCGEPIRYFVSGWHGGKWKHWPGPRKWGGDTKGKLHKAEPVKRKAKR